MIEDDLPIEPEDLSQKLEDMAVIVNAFKNKVMAQHDTDSTLDLVKDLHELRGSDKVKAEGALNEVKEARERINEF